MDLEFLITNQTITRTDTLIPRADSIGYLYAHFTFSSDWEDIAQKTAIFSNDTVAHKVLLDINNKCAVPSSLLVSGKFQVSIFAEDITPKRYTANEATVWVWESGYTPDTDEEAEEAVSVYAQMLAKYEEILAIVEAIPPIPNGVMKKVISYTVPAGASTAALTWTQDDAGNALALIDCKIVVSVPSNSVSVGSIAYIRGRFNDISSGYYTSYITAAPASAMHVCAIRTSYGASVLETQKTNPLIARASIGASDGTNNLNNAGITRCAGVVSAITKIYLYVETLTYFPDGTTIEIYGRTA